LLFALCSLLGQDNAASFGIQGDETFDIEGLEGEIKPRQDAALVIRRGDGGSQREKLKLRIDASDGSSRVSTRIPHSRRQRVDRPQ
jgi:aconitase A